MDNWEVSLHPLVHDDVEEGWSWYVERSDRAAEKFRKAVREAVDRLLINPEMRVAYFENYKRCFVRGFSYAVVYRCLPERRVRVLSVAAFSKEPGFWLGRDT